MTTRPYELLARFGNDDTVAGAHIRRIISSDGQEFESPPIPLAEAADDPAFSRFAEQFSAAIIAERDELKTKADQYDAVVAERDALAAELEALRNPPRNSRHLPPYSFLLRFTAPERLSILQASTTDANIAMILVTLQTVRYVDLDTEDTQQSVGYIASLGIVGQSRVAEILADATEGEL
jgi:hypothetical protein